MAARNSQVVGIKMEIRSADTAELQIAKIQ